MYDDLFKDAFSDLNLTYLPYQSEETAGISCSFPDASFTTVVVPLTFSKEALEGLGAVIQDLERAKIPSTGVLKSAMTVVNYLEGKCPDVPTHEVEHLEWLLLQGLLPLGMPVWEGNLEQRVLTSRRISPVLFLTIAQAYLPRTLEILVNRALVVSKTSPHKDRMAFLLHTMDTAFVKSVSNFTSDQSRRIFLPLYEDGKEATTELFAQASSDTTTIQELGQRLNSVMADFETTRDGITAKMVTLADDVIANQKGFGA